MSTRQFIPCSNSCLIIMPVVIDNVYVGDIYHDVIAWEIDSKDNYASVFPISFPTIDLSGSHWAVCLQGDNIVHQYYRGAKPLTLDDLRAKWRKLWPKQGKVVSDA